LGDGNGGGAGPAVHGSSDDGVDVSGVSGSANATEGLTFGHGYGHSSLRFSVQPGGGVIGVSALGSGVEGLTFNSSRGNSDVAAVRGQGANGFAGLFVRKVRVTDALQKGGGGFTIDHPSDPHNKYLSHSFVESPEMLNVYSGTVTTNSRGTARVRMPACFEALNRPSVRRKATKPSPATICAVAETNDKLAVDEKHTRFIAASFRIGAAMSWCGLNPARVNAHSVAAHNRPAIDHLALGQSLRPFRIHDLRD
jgi:hypothetical protein